MLEENRLDENWVHGNLRYLYNMHYIGDKKKVPTKIMWLKKTQPKLILQGWDPDQLKKQLSNVNLELSG